MGDSELNQSTQLTPTVEKAAFERFGFFSNSVVRCDWFVRPTWLFCVFASLPVGKLSKTAQATRNTITLKGSTEVVTEFLAYAVNRCVVQELGALCDEHNYLDVASPSTVLLSVSPLS